MTENAQRLAERLIRNFNDAVLQPEVKEPKYESMCLPLARGTAALLLALTLAALAQIQIGGG